MVYKIFWDHFLSVFLIRWTVHIIRKTKWRARIFQ